MGRNRKDFDTGRPDSWNQGHMWAPGAKEKAIADTHKQMIDLGYKKFDSDTDMPDYADHYEERNT